MIPLSRTLVSLSCAAALASVVGCGTAGSGGSYGSESRGAAAGASAQRSDIVDTAVAAGNFGTLAKALERADLVATLKGPGPFTVFAPTDAAFAKIPRAQLDALLADKARLTEVLTYHVVPGRIMASDVSTGRVKTVAGEPLDIDASGMGVRVNDARVIKTDIVASNGVIHVIDAVVLPR